MKTYNETEALENLKVLKIEEDWTVKDNALYIQYSFKDFREAMQFMVLAGKIADAQDHHPNWNNVWNRVEIHLNTHSAKGITDKDFDLALAMHYIFKEGSYLAVALY